MPNRKNSLGNTWSVGDTVQVYSPAMPEHGLRGTIEEIHERASGTIRYTVVVDGRSLGLSEGHLRRPRIQNSSLGDINRRIAREVSLESAGFVESLVRKLDRVSRQRNPRLVQLSVEEQDVVRHHFGIDGGGWFDWNGRQIVISESGSIRTL